MPLKEAVRSGLGVETEQARDVAPGARLGCPSPDRLGTSTRLRRPGLGRVRGDGSSPCTTPSTQMARPDVLRRFLVPRLLDPRPGQPAMWQAEPDRHPLAPIVGHRMAEAGLEMAVWMRNCAGRAILCRYFGRARSTGTVRGLGRIEPSIPACSTW